MLAVHFILTITNVYIQDDKKEYSIIDVTLEIEF